MVARFVVEHDPVSKASRLVDRILNEVAEFCLHDDDSMAALAAPCEAEPALFQDFTRRELRVIRGRDLAEQLETVVLDQLRRGWL